jgi:NDP-sugar pyrophosphorylase family protein
MTVVGVIPAAGYARRLQSLAGSKELLPVHASPVMDYLIHRMQSVPGVEVRVVTRPEKRDVIDHARRRGATVIEGYPATSAESFLLGTRELYDDDVVLMGFPDSIWDPIDGYVRLLAVLHEHSEADAVLGLFDCADLERSDVVSVDEHGLVTQVQVKPESPASDLVWGCAVAPVRALAALERYSEAGHLFDDLARRRRVRGVRFRSEFVDVGTPEVLDRLRGVG